MFGIYIILVIAILLTIKFCKKTLKLVLTFILGIAFIYFVMLGGDIQRANNLEEPIFIWKEVSTDDNGSYSAKGLLYNVKVRKDIKGNVECVELTIGNKVVAASIT